MIKNVKLGSDPELFIINEKSGEVVSSIGLIPGEKGKPWTEGLPEGYGLEIDNILAEFNIPPCSTKEEWIHHMNFMKDFIRNFVKKVNPDYGLMHKASAYVDPKILDNEIAQLFGCSVSYNAYTQAPNPRPEGDKTNLRSSGVHIHCSYDNPDMFESLLLIKYFDAYLGLPSVIMDPDTERRKLYGKAGDFRGCSYGFEYRSLSGFFLKNDDTIGFMWDQAMKAIEAYNNGVELPDETIVQNTINNSDVETAKQLVKSFKLIKFK
jgi:hypothetical protein